MALSTMLLDASFRRWYNRRAQVGRRMRGREHIEAFCHRWWRLESSRIIASQVEHWQGAEFVNNQSIISDKKIAVDKTLQGIAVDRRCSDEVSAKEK